jgi:hypothetical protein
MEIDKNYQNWEKRSYNESLVVVLWFPYDTSNDNVVVNFADKQIKTVDGLIDNNIGNSIQLTITIDNNVLDRIYRSITSLLKRYMKNKCPN